MSFDKIRVLDLYFNEHKDIGYISSCVGYGEIYVIAWIHEYLHRNDIKQNDSMHGNTKNNDLNSINSDEILILAYASIK